MIVALRKYILTRHKKVPLSAPVIVVGNITVGGTGKTPLVIALVNYLKSKGYRPGVVSRGYGGQTVSCPMLVSVNMDPKQVGDEPLLIARHTSVPVIVCPNRYISAKQLIDMHQCNVIVSDDGLQHYALERIFEIVVIDGMRGFGNHFCLPAGPLREPVSRLRTVDMIVINENNALKSEYQALSRLTQPICAMSFEPGKIFSVTDTTVEKNIDFFVDKKVYAIAGIGNPDRFFQTLLKMGIHIIEKPFPDHYCFNDCDFDFVEASALILMTEKDAVKCQVFADERFWFLSGMANVDEECFNYIDCRLEQVLGV